MSYQVLARKWRPRTFHELVGQEHVSRALVNALDQGRLHHAYLFTGTRGVGKTTLARILSKCLNCEQGVTSRPCGTCQTCVDIDNGRFVDLIEVDAASRTKVEDTRELLDNVQYAPTQGRYKVYLIDEVHMLSTHSFNALLKTLEEPPPHVKFLLATTDPQKLPVTVLSRCLQFTLKNMPPERVVEHLQKVLEAEQVAFEVPALWLLGKAADGSMRDAMSLTDQAIAFGQGEIRREDVAAMLGTLDHAHLVALAEALAEVDAERLLAEVASLAEQGPDFAGILDEIAGLMHRLAIAQMVPGALDNGHGDREQLLALAGRFTAEDVQLYYQIALQGRADIDNAPDTRTALEMALLRMLAFRPQGVPTPPQTELPLRGQPAASERSAEAPAAEPVASPASASDVDSPARRTPDAADTQPRDTADTQPHDSPPWAMSQAMDTASAPPAEGAALDSPRAPQPGDSQPPFEAEPPAALEPVQASSASEPDASPPAPPWGRDAPAPEIEAPVAPGEDQAEFEGAASTSENAASVALDHAMPEADQNFPEEPEDAASEPLDETLDDVASDGDGGDSASSASAFESWSAERDATDAPTPENASAEFEEQAVWEPVEAPSDAAMPVDAGTRLSHDAWLEHFDALEIGGLTRNLAAHCVVAEDDGRSVRLTLDPGQSAMLSETHVERITKALGAFGYVRRVDIDVAPLDGSRETPKTKRDRQARERHALAVEALRGDPHVQELESHFGARLMEESVIAGRVDPAHDSTDRAARPR